MGIESELEKTIENLHKQFDRQKKQAYKMLCEVDILSGCASMSLRTEAYRNLCEMALKPEHDLISLSALEVKMFCIIAASELTGVKSIPQRSDSRYGIIAKEMHKIIEVTHAIIKESSKHLSHDNNIGAALKALSNILEKEMRSDEDELSPEVKTPLKNNLIKHAEKCVSILDRYNILSINDNTVDRKTMYGLLASGLVGVSIPRGEKSASLYNTVFDLERFIFCGFEIIKEEHGYALPDRENSKYKAMIVELWDTIVSMVKTNAALAD